MILGSISPLIFTTSPTFTNIFNTGEEFLTANGAWINRITTSRGLPRVTARSIDPSDTIKSVKRAPVTAGDKSYKVGKVYETSKPQTVVENAPKPNISSVDENLLDDTPF